MIAEKTKERPIIFTGESPKWILDGRKTQTRRVIKFNKLSNIKKGRLFYSTTFDSWAIEGGEADIELVKCPYGKPGDHLWVRETWQDDTFCRDGDKSAIYKADNPTEILPYGWKSPYYMPRWASRINLEITNIRVERVQDISNDDCIKESIYPVKGNFGEIMYEGSATQGMFSDPKTPFQFLWDSINKKRGYGWSVNPYVWVIEFKRI